jgi:hypothetical protein
MEPKGKRLHTLGHRETKPLIVGQVAAISLQPEYPAMLLLGVDHFSLKKPLRRVFIPQNQIIAYKLAFTPWPLRIELIGT